MKKSMHIECGTSAEFVANYNAAMEELAGCEILREKDLPDGSMIVFYDDPNSDEIEQIRKRAEAAFENSNVPEYFIDTPDGEESCSVDIVEIRITASVPVSRYCCECSNYKWGCGCPYRNGHVRQMDSACGMFNVTVGRR